MKVEKGPLEGLLLVKLDVYSDERGFFVERYHEKKFKERGLPTDFPQDNHSRSKPGVLRGLHYQHDPAQGKFVGVPRGAIWDVVVDIRPDSKTFGEYIGVELSDNNATLLWIPPGFAHGFCVLGNKDADVVYHVTALYNSVGEGGIKWDDKEISIDWPIKNPIVSERDRNLPSFADYKKSPPNWNK